MRSFFNFIFKYLALLSIIIIFIFLAILFTSIIRSGYKAFYTHYITLPITLTPDAATAHKSLNEYTFYDAVSNSLNKVASPNHIDAPTMRKLISANFNRTIIQYLQNNEGKINTRANISLLLATNSDMFYKNYDISYTNLDPNSIQFLNTAKANGLVQSKFNWIFFTNKDSRHPELTGIVSALKGSIVTIVLTLVFAFIIGVATAIYIQEYLKVGPARSILEVNINNLAAVPSIIFGLLGLSIFQNILGIPRSSPLLASIVLTLMILPNIIVYSQIAFKAVPNYIREAAYGIGASKNQVVFKHVFPLALPGIITGLIIGISRALGETAPLLIIGMYIFAANTHITILGAGITLPTQILMWFNMPEIGFVEKTSAAIIVLVVFTIATNLLASYFRKKFTKKL